MGERIGGYHSNEFDEEGFLKMMTGLDPAVVDKMASDMRLGPLTETHWRVIEFVRSYYENHGVGPPIVRISKATGLRCKEICTLFPCGLVKGAYRLAGLPRPAGCI